MFSSWFSQGLQHSKTSVSPQALIESLESPRLPVLALGWRPLRGGKLSIQEAGGGRGVCDLEHGDVFVDTAVVI